MAIEKEKPKKSGMFTSLSFKLISEHSLQHSLGIKIRIVLRTVSFHSDALNDLKNEAFSDS